MLPSLVALLFLVALSLGYTRESADGREVIVYKSATCGSCKGWMCHLEVNGFTVKACDVRDLAEVKRQNGVDPRLGSCHTAKVGGYVVEGHVPAQDIKRLLSERRAVSGLSVPGMPMDWPGMEGSRKDPYDVSIFDHAGKTSVYARY